MSDDLGISYVINMPMGQNWLFLFQTTASNLSEGRRLSKVNWSNGRKLIGDNVMTKLDWTLIMFVSPELPWTLLMDINMDVLFKLALTVFIIGSMVCTMRNWKASEVMEVSLVLKRVLCVHRMMNYAGSLYWEPNLMQITLCCLI